MDVLDLLYARLAMELSGTALLAFTIYRSGHSELSGIEQSVVAGLCVALLVHILGRHSGAHLNPAVTIVFWVQNIGSQKSSLVKSIGETMAYISSQVVGSIAGICLARNGTPLHTDHRLDGFVEEIVLTIILLLLVVTWSREGKLCAYSQPLTGIVIGGGVTFLAALGGLTSSGVFNPAISLGLIVSGQQMSMQSMLAAQLIAVVIVSLVIRFHQRTERY